MKYVIENLDWRSIEEKERERDRKRGNESGKE